LLACILYDDLGKLSLASGRCSFGEHLLEFSKASQLRIFGKNRKIKPISESSQSHLLIFWHLRKITKHGYIRAWKTRIGLSISGGRA
jgi:hypothetical protein